MTFLSFASRPSNMSGRRHCLIPYVGHTSAFRASLSAVSYKMCDYYLLPRGYAESVMAAIYWKSMSNYIVGEVLKSMHGVVGDIFMIEASLSCVQSAPKSLVPRILIMSPTYNK